MLDTYVDRYGQDRTLKSQDQKEDFFHMVREQDRVHEELKTHKVKLIIHANGTVEKVG